MDDFLIHSEKDEDQHEDADVYQHVLAVENAGAHMARTRKNRAGSDNEEVIDVITVDETHYSPGRCHVPDGSSGSGGVIYQPIAPNEFSDIFDDEDDFNYDDSNAMKKDPEDMFERQYSVNNKPQLDYQENYEEYYDQDWYYQPHEANFSAEQDVEGPKENQERDQRQQLSGEEFDKKQIAREKQREARRRQYHNMTPEERENLNAKRRVQRQAKRAELAEVAKVAHEEEEKKRHEEEQEAKRLEQQILQNVLVDQQAQSVSGSTSTVNEQLQGSSSGSSSSFKKRTNSKKERQHSSTRPNRQRIDSGPDEFGIFAKMEASIMRKTEDAYALLEKKRKT